MMCVARFSLSVGIRWVGWDHSIGIRHPNSVAHDEPETAPSN